MNNEKMFQNLVQNALDFLETSISELEQQPKYSVIHFSAAIELFLKARLMYEHWTLIIAKNQELDLQKFVNGNFQSITLEESITRLRKVVGSEIGEVQSTTFRCLADHRNRIIHFYHIANTKANNDELVINIVKEQLKAWYSLHQLLTKEWDQIFSQWEEEIESIDTQLRGLHPYLKIVYDNLRDEIALLRERGLEFHACPSCGFEAQQHEDVVEELYNAKCLVCGLASPSLKIECPECDEMVTFFNEGFAVCASCEHQLEPKDIAERLYSTSDAHYAAMNGDDSSWEGNCADCDGYHTLIRIEDDHWICASCFGEYDSIQYCQWCNEPNTADMEYSYVSGCNHCQGFAGWHEDD